MILLKLLSPLFYFFLKRRYRITIKGAELLQLKGAKLVIPNHPAQVDAQILAPMTLKHWDLVPVSSARFLKMPLIGYLMRSMNTIAVSDLTRGSRNANVLNEIIDGTQHALKKERSVIIYPAGSIKMQAKEIIRNKKSTYEVVKVFPKHAKIIGVRIYGLWGSIWSSAWLGRKPHFGITLLKSMALVFANLIFFLPKREVTYEFVDITSETKEFAKKDRKTFNNYLENFYNEKGVEEVKYIRHFFFLPLRKPRKSIN
jgi:long-chain-fatty-acid--[acyl-carrier-protein] ligase